MQFPREIAKLLHTSLGKSRKETRIIMAGNLTITRDGDRYAIDLAGRANFETAVPLRDFIKNLGGVVLGDITVNLKECIGMDSTCMGVLSMLALTARKRKVTMTLLNAGNNRQLLKGLGVDKLFNFSEEAFTPFVVSVYPAPQVGGKSQLSAAETVLEAHDTLIDADEDNQQRFGAVVAMARKDVDRLKK